MLFAANMFVKDSNSGEIVKFAARIDALSWEEAADRADELGLEPCGPILMGGRMNPMTIDEYYPEVETMPPCPQYLQHRFEL